MYRLICFWQPATDFFGRPLKTPPKKKNADGKTKILSLRNLLIMLTSPFNPSGSIQTAQNDVWYHFKEGYSNAVRRSAKMSDFV